MAALWLRAMVAVGLVALAAGTFQYLLRKLPAGLARWRPRRRTIRVLDAAPMANGAMLYVVRIGDRTVALGGGRDGLAFLCDLPGYAETQE